MMLDISKLNRINIVGSSGVGKSTLSKKIASLLDLNHVELDGLYWKANWTPSSDEEFGAALDHHFSQDNWILDGNYAKKTTSRWTSVDTVIWLDYSWSRTFYQTIKRATKRVFCDVELWHGNKESFRSVFLSKDSIILWMLNNYKRQKDYYSSVIVDPQWSHIQFIRITSPKEAEQFLSQLNDELR